MSRGQTNPVVASADNVRVVAEANGVQWMLQYRYQSGGRAQWHSESFCRTKEALLRIIATDPRCARLRGDPVLAALPDWFPEATYRTAKPADPADPTAE
jgi:hypothetical protein